MFDIINSIYYDQIISYFINNGFSVYKVVFSGNLDNYNNRDILFLYKKIVFNNTKFGPGLYIDDDNVAVFTPITKDSIEEEAAKLEIINEHKFVDRINKLDDFYEDGAIYINSNYDDYNLFYKFRDLEVIMPKHYSQSFDTFYEENGIIFPFYFESNEIISHNLDSLYNFVKNKAINTHLSISDIKMKYKGLIDLVKELTRDSPKWNDFFRNNDFCHR